MPLARVRSGALVGIDGIPLDVEVDIGTGDPSEWACNSQNTIGSPYPAGIVSVISTGPAGT